MSTRIPQSFINDLLTKIDIITVVSRFIEFKKRSGSNHLALCPFHNEKTPSFNVSSAKQIYHCFGCGVSGNAITFLMEYERLDFIEALENLAQLAGVELPKLEENLQPTNNQTDQKNNLFLILEKTVKYYQTKLSENKFAQEYINKRGFSPKTIEKFNIGFAPNNWDALINLHGKNNISSLESTGLIIKKGNGSYFDRFRNRIIFPIKNRRGRFVAFGGRVLDDSLPKYLNSPETTLFHKSNELYGLYDVYQTYRSGIKQLLVVEGYADVVSLFEHGIDYAVATLGTATTPNHLETLFRYAEEVIFCFDGDKAGRAAAWHAIETMLPVMRDNWMAKFIFLPEEEDPDSFIKTQKKANFEAYLKRARSLSDVFFAKLISKLDLNSIDSKAKLADSALKYIKNIKASFTVELFLNKLSELTKIDAEKLKTNLNVERQDIIKNNKNFAPSEAIEFLPLKMIIVLLVQNPNLINYFDAKVLTAKIPGITLLQELYTAIFNENISTAMLVEKYRNTKYEKIITQLVTHQHIIPQEGVEREFLGFIQLLKKRIQDQEIELLLNKFTLNSKLNNEERIGLQNLMKNRINLL